MGPFGKPGSLGAFLKAKRGVQVNKVGLGDIFPGQTNRGL